MSHSESEDDDTIVIEQKISSENCLEALKTLRTLWSRRTAKTLTLNNKVVAITGNWIFELQMD